MHGHHPSIADTFIYWINFLIFCGAMYFLTRKAISAAWTNRRAKLLLSIDGAKNEFVVANEKYEIAERRYMQLEDKINELKNTINSEADKESLNLVESAKKSVELSKAKAKQSIESELRVALKAMQKSAIENAFQKATSIMKSSVDDNMNNKLVEKAINDSSKFMGVLN